MSLRALVLLVIVAGGCSASAPEPRTSPAVPVLLSVEVVSGEPRAGARMTLRARLDQQGHWPYPVAVEWEVPPGVIFAAGAQAAVVGPGEPQVVEIELAEVPDQDLVVTASSTGPGAGFHARAVYRFGRAAPPPWSGPEKTGPSPTLNGHDLGPSVPMD
jgi:hypothetical protein